MRWLMEATWAIPSHVECQDGCPCGLPASSPQFVSSACHNRASPFNQNRPKTLLKDQRRLDVFVFYIQEPGFVTQKFSFPIGKHWF